ncbi:MAG: glycerol-3-phosphate dehydrogenase [Caulobacteraceae bacterium]
MNVDFDLLVVGGGINGAGIARDAAGRGLRVMLVEQGDLASGTSSASTKLIHGGLRYLEQYEFRLVREALAERERLMSIAPHLVRPLRFVLPHDRRMRPAWMLRLGLFLYDHLGARRRLPSSAAVRLGRSPLGAGLDPGFERGFAYWDCWGDDSRLVVANAQDAAERGATVLTSTRLRSARREDGVWSASLEDSLDGHVSVVTAGILVNAAGSWVGEVLSDRLDLHQQSPLRLVRGSHIVTRRLYEGDHAYVLQNPDGRIIFIIPYEREFTLIGTTDVAWTGGPEHPRPDAEEIAYLRESASRGLASPVRADDVVWSYAGLRPLYGDEVDEPSKVSRDYVLDLDASPGLAPLLSIFGGKITTYRALAEHAMTMLRPFLGEVSGPWTSQVPLPGGDIRGGDLEALEAELAIAAPYLSELTRRRWVTSYGSRALRLLEGVQTEADLGEDFGAGLTQREVDYLVREEWARTGDDILWRRSKLGLYMTGEGMRRLSIYLERSLSQPTQGKATAKG